MALAITHHRILVNQYLDPLVRGVFGEFGKPDEKTRAKVKGIVERLEQYWLNGGLQRTEDEVVNDEVEIRNYLRFVEIPLSREVITGIYEELHQVLRDQPVIPQLYIQLGRAFRALDIEPKGDIAEAIGKAHSLRVERSYMTWANEKDRLARLHLLLREI